MSFEVRKGRSCDSLQVLNERIIKSQGEQLLNYGQIVRLTESKVLTFEALVENAKESNQILTQQFALDISKEKRKVKKWRGVAIIQTIGVIGLLLLL